MAVNKSRKDGKADALPSMRVSSEMREAFGHKYRFRLAGSSEKPAGIEGVNRGIQCLTLGRAAHEISGLKQPSSFFVL
jgi:hypothetical protein